MRARKRLVVDASVICASGPLGLLQNIPLTEEDLTPRQCQETLSQIRELGYRIVLTPPILDEWERCQPEAARIRRLKFAEAWILAMTRQQRFEELDVAPDENLRGKIEDLAVEEGVRKILREDVHLIEAALATDRIVIARDIQAWKHFNAAAYRIEEFRAVVWVDPCKTETDCVKWLKNGARIQKKLQLGFDVL